jgi:hypothetical protein
MSSFLRLPRELRDQIYKDVLYNSNGILYKPGKNGGDRLCARPSKLPSRKTRFAWPRRASFAGIHASNRKHRRDVNQLKYVCRQLYNETKGLIVRQNLVYLEDTSTWNAIEQCVYLFRHWPIFRRVAIKCTSKSFGSEVGRKNLLAVVQHCIENADVSVRVHIPHWSQADPNFVLRGLSYLLTLRKEARIIAQLAQIRQIPFLSDSETKSVAVNVEIPCNLRWFPQDEQFDRPLFVRNVCEHPTLSVPPAQAVVLDMIELVASWFVHGL